LSDRLAFLFQAAQGKLRDARHALYLDSARNFLGNKERINQLTNVQASFPDQLSHFVGRTEPARPMS
jgi:hypothetical protein